MYPFSFTKLVIFWLFHLLLDHVVIRNKGILWIWFSKHLPHCTPEVTPLQSLGLISLILHSCPASKKLGCGEWRRTWAGQIFCPYSWAAFSCVCPTSSRGITVTLENGWDIRTTHGCISFLSQDTEMSSRREPGKSSSKQQWYHFHTGQLYRWEGHMGWSVPLQCLFSASCSFAILWDHTAGNWDQVRASSNLREALFTFCSYIKSHCEEINSALWNWDYFDSSSFVFTVVKESSLSLHKDVSLLEKKKKKKLQWSDTLIIIKNFSVDLTVHFRHFWGCGNSSAFKLMNIVWLLMKSTSTYIHIYIRSLCYAYIHLHTYMLLLGLFKKKSNGSESTFFKRGSNCLLCVFYRSLLFTNLACNGFAVTEG